MPIRSAPTNRGRRDERAGAGSKITSELVTPGSGERPFHQALNESSGDGQSAVKLAGRHEVVWDARARNGARLNPGVYFVKLESGGASRTRRLVVLE